MNKIDNELCVYDHSRSSSNFKESDVFHPDQANETHLVKPSNTSRAFAVTNNLVAVRKYIHLIHEDTFIHGPFDFATVNNRKTRDRISQVDWNILAKYSHRFRNPLPSFDVPTYSIHVDNGVHFSFNDKHHSEVLFTQNLLSPDDQLLPLRELQMETDDDKSLFSTDDEASLFSDDAL